MHWLQVDKKIMGKATSGLPADNNPYSAPEGMITGENRGCRLVDLSPYPNG
jgi:hypothetical protein